MEPPPPASLFAGSTRKQNVACDACRAKKIRCQRVSTSQICGQCAARGLECTSNYIEQLQNKPRRPRRFKSNEEKNKQSSIPSDDDSRNSPPTLNGTSSRPSSAGNRADAGPSIANGHDVSMSANGATLASPHRPPAPLHHDTVAWLNEAASSVFKRDAASLQASLLRYLFCPVPVIDQEWRYSDIWGMEQARKGLSDIWEEAKGEVWDEAPTTAHLALWAGAENELESMAIELIDSYFTIVDPRFPILDAHEFMARFQAPNTHPLGPLHHALLATVLAFGARFVDHAVFQADRDESTARDVDAGGRSRSRLVQLLVIRAREVMEMHKACRVATIENAQTLILMEALICQSAVLRSDYRANNLGAASRHLDQIKDAPFMHVTAEKDAKTRAQLALYISSGTEAAFFRLKTDGWIAEVNGSYSGSYEGQLDSAPMGINGASVEDLWLLAARTGTGVIKRLCGELWQPRVKANGIPLTLLRDFTHDQSSWRDLYLTALGMPASWPATELEFSATMRAATTDILFHSMWLVTERAVRDFGIQEPDDTTRHMFGFEVQQMKERLSQEAVHSALRIAMLAVLATERGLLRLDPLVLYRPIYDAGIFLARRGQDECLGCVAGLRQYAIAYPQMWDLADEIDAALQKARGNGPATSLGVPATMAA